MNRRFHACVFIGLIAGLAYAQPSLAQSSMGDSLKRLDRNGDGQIEPDEITSLARPFMERVGRARRISLDRPNSVNRWLEAVQYFYSEQNGSSGRHVRPQGESSVKPFGPDQEQAIVPEFGLAEIKFPYTQEDLDEADRTLRRSDRNKDGYLDTREIARADWTHRDPYEEDANNDLRLDRLELAQRYARRRLIKDDSGELIRKAWRTGSGVRESEQTAQRQTPSNDWRRGGRRYYLTATVLSRFDTNKNGRLDQKEALPLGVPAGRIDTDRDGELSREELYAYFGEIQDKSESQAAGLPGWFAELDTNRDRQVAMSEFTGEWTEEKLDEFLQWDANGDGLLTSAEIMNSNSLVGGSFGNETAEVLPPKKTIISEIVVDDDFLIGDLNVQLSITHTYVSQLDAYLIGPDGQRVELFTEIGGHDDHFDQTVFDDQSRYPIVKARPPFKGTFIPEALTKKQPSLSSFNDKSVRGVWQLSISSSRSDRFGMLHNWTLIAKPKDRLDSIVAAPASDGPQPVARTDYSRFSSRSTAKPLLGGKSPYITGDVKVKYSGEQKKVEWQRQIERYREYIKERRASGNLSEKESRVFEEKLKMIDAKSKKKER